MSNADLVDKAGDYFDKKIRAYCITKFCESHNYQLDHLELLNSKKDKLDVDSERSKIDLSDSLKTDVSVVDFFNDQDLMVQLRREDFEKDIKPVVDEAFTKLLNSVHSAGLSESEIDHVLMIGGSSLIPLVQEKMRDKFSVNIETLQNADSIIAEGASLVSYYSFKPFLVNPIQIKLYDNSDYTIFEKSTILTGNNSKTITLFCTDNRDGEARLIVSEGDERKSVMNIPVERGIPEPFKHERIECNFQIDENFIINASGKGATQDFAGKTQIHELRYGLMIQSEKNRNE